jgi:DHA2 family multidrug resistance protein
MFVTGVAMFCTAPIAGRLSSAIDPRKVLAAGIVTVSIGLWLNAQMNAEVSFWDLFIPQLVRGAGLVLCIVPITAAALGTLPTDLVSSGSGLFNVFRNMGGAVGLAMINTQWNDRFHYHYWHLAESLSSTSQIVTQYVTNITRHLAEFPGLNGTAHSGALRIISGQVSQQAAIMAWNDIFLIMAFGFAIAAPLVFMLARPEHTDVQAH